MIKDAVKILFKFFFIFGQNVFKINKLVLRIDL